MGVETGAENLGLAESYSLKPESGTARHLHPPELEYQTIILSHEIRARQSLTLGMFSIRHEP